MSGSASSPTATLRDVARAAGVSTASASRALAGEGSVSAELHARIMAAAARLGYQANLAARALVSGRSRLVGIVAETLADPLIAAVVEQLDRGLGAHGYGTLFASAGSPERSLAATRVLIGRGAEALVFAGARPLPAEIDLVGAHGLPWLEVSDSPGLAGLGIDIGRRRGGALAGRYLLELGHRCYGVVGRCGAGIRQGVAATLAENGLGRLLPDPTTGSEDPDSIRSAMRALLDGDELPTAFICGSDAEALAAVRECSMRGIIVPHDIAIVGFGDEEFARYAVPALTTIRASAPDIGAHGAEMLLARLAGNLPRAFEAPIKLVVRQSTGPASA
jgi:DNA-binding LacI/PurR family transcriptional regulator